MLDDLARKKLRGEHITAVEFDQVFGDYDALVDVPAIWFATDLLEAYPDAKVVLNGRQDVTEWKASFRSSVLPIMTSWRYWLSSFFNTELFWCMRLTNLMWMQVYFEGDFERHAVGAYHRHFDEIESMLSRQGRSHLDWVVQEGWMPLCHFFERSVPDSRFPQTNLAAEFGSKLAATDKGRMRKVSRNAVICGVALALILIQVV